MTGDYLVTYYANVMEDMESVFKALADSNRRLLLDKLNERDGQTLVELQRHLPEMTRFGTMKHLHVLEDAGLIITLKSGRKKFHYLNRVPIQLVYDRWVSHFAQTWTRPLTGLKTQLEEAGMSSTVSHLFEVYINAPQDRVWQALTDGSMTQQYYFGSAVTSDWKAGAPYKYVMPDGQSMIEGTIVDIDPPNRLVTTFAAQWEGTENEMPSTVIYELESLGDVTKLRLIHEGLQAASPFAEGFRDGWSQILSALKTLLETGKPLPLPTPG